MPFQTHWQPTARDNETPEEIPLSQWIGEALGAASMCWDPRPEGVFDGESAGKIADSLEAHVVKLITQKKSSSWKNQIA